MRKLFSVGLALNALGIDHRFETPVYRMGEVAPDGTLQGDLVLVASGDLTLGGRTTADGKVAFTNFDHTEANSLGSAILTKPDPLAGLDLLAGQVAASGIKAVAGDVIVDDRLFDQFRVPNGNVLITPIIVNDNLIDVTILPTEAGRPANVDWRPKTAAFAVTSEVRTVAAGEPLEISLETSPGDPGRRDRQGPDTGRVQARFARRADLGPDVSDRRSVSLCAHGADRSAGPGGRARHGGGHRPRSECEAAVGQRVSADRASRPVHVACPTRSTPG